MDLRASEIAEATGGRLVGDDVVVRGATHDSREDASGALFVPIVAERDGHDFIATALEAGAAAYLTERPAGEGTAIQVDDTMAALATLGRLARDRLPARVVGITGSVGKTSTKDLVTSVLRTRWTTAASARSFNNEIGVPLTLLDAPNDAEAVVVEMGMRGHGHLTTLCEIARPTVGVVTAVELVHAEALGSLDSVARAKGELIEALPASGKAILNAADRRVRLMADRTDAPVVFFGEGGAVRAESVHVDDELRPSFSLVTPWGTGQVRLEVRGIHQVSNALAAAATGLALGLPIEKVTDALASPAASPWRMDLQRSPSGARVLNDAYNAGPASMRAALRALAALPGERRVAVLGTMAELGSHAESAHREIAELAASLGVRVIAVDEPLYCCDETVPDVEAALECLGALDEGDAVLVKGSRVAALERVAEALLEGD